jgi:hypothetical protein
MLLTDLFDIGLDYFRNLFHAVLHLFDEHFLFLVLPVECLGLMSLVQVIDALKSLKVIGDLLHPINY